MINILKTRTWKIFFARNNCKVFYCRMEKVKSLISFHNKKVLSRENNKKYQEKLVRATAATKILLIKWQRFTKKFCIQGNNHYSNWIYGVHWIHRRTIQKEMVRTYQWYKKWKKQRNITFQVHLGIKINSKSYKL